MKPIIFITALSITSACLSQKDTTSIALTLNHKINGQSNVVYCSSIDFLWMELTNYLGEQPIPKEKNFLIDELNKINSNNQSPIKEEFWFAKVGLVENGIVDTIKKSYKKHNPFCKIC